MQRLLQLGIGRQALGYACCESSAASSPCDGPMDACFQFERRGHAQHHNFTCCRCLAAHISTYSQEGVFCSVTPYIMGPNSKELLKSSG